MILLLLFFLLYVDIVIVIGYKNLTLKFGSNWDSNTRYIVVDVFVRFFFCCCYLCCCLSRNKVLKYGKNQVDNGLGIEVVVLIVDDNIDVYVVVLKLLEGVLFDLINRK